MSGRDPVTSPGPVDANTCLALARPAERARTGSFAPIPLTGDETRYTHIHRHEDDRRAVAWIPPLGQQGLRIRRAGNLSPHRGRLGRFQRPGHDLPPRTRPALDGGIGRNPHALAGSKPGGTRRLARPTDVPVLRRRRSAFTRPAPGQSDCKDKSQDPHSTIVTPACNARVTAQRTSMSAAESDHLALAQDDVHDRARLATDEHLRRSCRLGVAVLAQ